MAAALIWLTIASAVLTFILALIEALDKDKRSKPGIIITIVFGVVTVILAITTTTTPAPAIRINGKRNGIVLEADKGLTLQYHIGSAKGKWHTYHVGARHR